MARSFSSELSDASPIVFHTDTGTLTDDEHRAVVEASVKELSQADNVASVSNPFEERSATVSRDARTAYATVVPSTALGDLSIPEAEEILDAARSPRGAATCRWRRAASSAARSPSPRTRPARCWASRSRC